MELIRRLAAILGITEEEATELYTSRGAEQALVEAGDSIDIDNPSDEDLERLGELGAVASEVRTAYADEDAAAEERRGRAAEALSSLRGDEAEATEPEAAPEGTAPEAAEPEAEAEPEETPEDEPAAVSADANVQARPVRQGERVVAASGDHRAIERPTRPVPAPVPRRVTPSQYSPRVPMRQGELASITAASDLPGIPSGARFETFRELGEAAFEKQRTFQGSQQSGRGGGDGNVPVAQFHARYPEELTVNGEDSWTTTTDKIEEAVAQRVREVSAAVKRVARGELESITAAGGFCAPTTPVYDLQSVSVADRPVRDSLASFQANRGGIRFVPPPHLGDVSGAVSTWSAATDATPGSSTKPCLAVTCTAVSETLLDAIPVCLQFGNFQARAFPEQVDRFMQLAIAYQARYADRKLLTAIGAGSTNISTGVQLGAWRDFLAEALKLSAQYRNRHRMAEDAPLRAILPLWARNFFATDIIRGPNQPTVDAFTMAVSIIERSLASFNLAVTWALDGETGQDYGTQFAGGALPWTPSIVWYLFHEGAWVFLDGGVLDIGLVRDSTLNAKNNFQNFSESFEQVVLRGVESQRITSSLCATGAIQALIDESDDICSSGS